MIDKIIGKYVPKLFIEFGSYTCKISNSLDDAFTEKYSLIALNKDFTKYQTLDEYFDPLTKENLSVYYPFEDGRISHFKSTEIFLELLIKEHLSKIKSRMKSLLGYEVLFSVHKPITEVQLTSISDVLKIIGAKSTKFVYEGVAAYEGSVDTDRGIVLHLGYSSSEIVVMEKTRVVYFKYLNFGGSDLLQEIKSYLRKKYQLDIPMKTIESLLRKIDVSIDLRNKKKNMNITGKSLSDGKPVKIDVSEKELANVIKDALKILTDLIDDVIIDLSSDFSSIISDQGVILTGGASKISGIAKYMEDGTNVQHTTRTKPTKAVVDGLNKISLDDNLASGLLIKDYILL